MLNHKNIENKIKSERTEQIKTKYKALSLEQALRRAAASLKNKAGLDDLKYLIEVSKVDLNTASNDGKKPLELCIDYTFKELETSVNSSLNKNVLKMKLQALSYLLIHSDLYSDIQARWFQDLLRNIEQKIQTTHKLYSENRATVKEGQNLSERLTDFVAFIFTLKSLLSYATKILVLKRSFAQLSRHKPYQFQPILLCENHKDTGAVLFSKTALSTLKKIGYKLIAFEYYSDLDLEKARAVSLEKYEQYKNLYTLDGLTKSQNTLQLLELLKEQQWALQTIDIIPYNKNFAHITQIAMEDYQLDDLSNHLRDQGMFYNLAILSEKYNGAIIGLVGAAHGLPIMDHFKQYGISPKEWLLAIPYKEKAEMGLGKYLLIDENGKEMSYARALLAYGAVDLCLSSERMDSSLDLFFKQLKKPEPLPQGKSITFSYTSDLPQAASSSNGPKQNAVPETVPLITLTACSKKSPDRP